MKPEDVIDPPTDDALFPPTDNALFYEIAIQLTRIANALEKATAPPQPEPVDPGFGGDEDEDDGPPMWTVDIWSTDRGVKVSASAALVPFEVDDTVLIGGVAHIVERESKDVARVRQKVYVRVVEK